MSFSSGSSCPAILPAIPRINARIVTYLCGLFFLSRLLVLSVAALSYMTLEHGPSNSPGRTSIVRFIHWDSGWYLNIAANGYAYSAKEASSVAFYPLYPLLMRAATYFGLDLPLAGYAISHLALLVSCFLLWKLAALETRSETVADRSVLFLLFCPGAVWFGMIYTESLFLMTFLGCLLCARQGRWVAAGIWGLASALTRTPGLLLAGFLFLEALQQWWDQRRIPAVAAEPVVLETPPEGQVAGPAANGDAVPTPELRGQKPAGSTWLARVALAIAGPIIGHISYLIFLQVRFGDWRAQQRTMAAGWGGKMRLPWTALADQWHVNEPQIMLISTPLLFITLGLSLIGLFTLKRISYPVLILTLCVLYVSATPGDSVTRYLSTAAPVYIVLAQMAGRSRLLEIAALIFSVGLMVLLTILIVNGYHII